MSQEMAVELRSLKKSFGDKVVLNDVSLEVPRGKTFAFLGRNGAGKTTTIRILLGLLRADGGEARVLGLDPTRRAMEIRRRVGYLAEDQQMFGWMRVEQLMKFIGAFYPTSNDSLRKRLAKKFDIPLKAKVKTLSKGQNVRLGLLLAMVHQPEVVILDDPTLGLDPIMRKEFLRDVVSYLQSVNMTVFFSSHLLYEIEPVADIVGILEGGRMIVQSPTEQLRENVKQLIVPSAKYQNMSNIPGVLDAVVHGQQTAVVVENAGQAIETFEQAGVTPRVNDLNLDEIFEAYVLGRQQAHDWQVDLERVV
jgi:ABC-2 type transport system ATP-binding protein